MFNLVAMENLSLKYWIIFCMILVIKSPLRINGENCKLSTEDELRIKLSQVESKMQGFEKLLINLENYTSHYRHYLTEAKEMNEDMDKKLQDLSSKAEPIINEFERSDCYWLRTHLYLGKKSHTQSGYNCQRWDSQHPNKHGYTLDHLFPDQSASAAQNYCRDPGRSGKLWCFTKSRAKKWEHCHIPSCQ